MNPQKGDPGASLNLSFKPIIVPGWGSQPWENRTFDVRVPQAPSLYLPGTKTEAASQALSLCFGHSLFPCILNLAIPSCYSPLFLQRRLGRWGQAASKDTTTARVAARSLAGGEDSRRLMVSWASQKGSEDISCSYRIFPAFTWRGRGTHRGWVWQVGSVCSTWSFLSGWQGTGTL